MAISKATKQAQPDIQNRVPLTNRCAKRSRPTEARPRFVATWPSSRARVRACSSK